MSSQIDFDKNIRQAEKVIGELISSEEKFGGNMKAAFNAWNKYYLNNNDLKLSSEQKRDISNSLKEAYVASEEFLKSIQLLQGEIPKPPKMTDLIDFCKKYEAVFKSHSERYTKAMAKMAILNDPVIVNKIVGFENKILKKTSKKETALEEDLNGQKTFYSLLIQPAQRVPRLEILARELVGFVLVKNVEGKDVPIESSLVALARHSGTRINESLRIGKVLEPGIEENFMFMQLHLKEITNQVKDNPQLARKLNLDQKEIENLVRSMDGLSIQSNDPAALSVKNDCKKAVLSACEDMLKKIEKQISGKEPNTFKKLLINVGFMDKNKYKADRENKYSILFDSYNKLKKEYEKYKKAEIPQPILAEYKQGKKLKSSSEMMAFALEKKPPVPARPNPPPLPPRPKTTPKRP